jgi:hypothetical protein
MVIAEIIRYLRDRTITEQAEAQNALRIQELTLGQRIKHHILYDKEIPVHFLEATVQDRQVTLYGVANSSVLVEAALSAAREAVSAAKIPGGPGSENMQVRSDIQVVQEYTVMP